MKGLVNEIDKPLANLRKTKREICQSTIKEYFENRHSKKLQKPKKKWMHF